MTLTGCYAAILRGNYLRGEATVDGAKVNAEFKNAAKTYTQNFDESDDPLVRRCALSAAARAGPSEMVGAGA